MNSMQTMPTVQTGIVRICTAVTVLLSSSVSIVHAACDAEFQSMFLQANQAENIDNKISGFKKALSLCPAPMAYLQLGNAYLVAEQADKALAALDNARNNTDSSDPNMLNLLLTIEAQRAQALYRQGKIPEALASINSAIKRAPQPPEWMLQVRKMIDLDERRQMMSATQITRSLYSSRSFDSRFGVAVSIDVFVLFDYNSDQLTKAGKQQADELARALVQPGTLQDNEKAIIIGHTDKRGSADYNMNLSQMRAASVVKWIEQNYPSLKGRLAASGRGLTQLLYPGDSDEDHRLNRRVEVAIVAD